jgi:hypothetical protein
MAQIAAFASWRCDSGRRTLELHERDRDAQRLLRDSTWNRIQKRSWARRLITCCGSGFPAGETVPGLSRVGRRPLHFFDVGGPRNKELDYRPIKGPLKTIALPYASPTTLATTDTRVIPLITPTIVAVNTILNELLPSRICPGPLRLWVTDLP